MTKRLAISSNDFGLFDGELNSYEYEYFCKHIGAFKRFMQEEPKEQRQLFLDAFCEYSYNHIEIKAVATMSDPKKKFIESFRQYAQEAFINGKFSVAKQFLNDSVIVARNRHMIGNMDSHSYAKDPFFHKDTRDVFRRLFGEPTEAGTCVKVICVLPLYVRFAGSICRYLKKWLDMEESLYAVPVKTGKKTKAEKRAIREQAIAIARNVAIAQQTKPKSSQKIASSSQQRSAATGASKTGSAGDGASSKSITNGEQSNALVPNAESKSCTQAELDDAEDFSSFYYDMHERKQRKRDLRKKGKKHEHLACQHPCHGKVCNCNPHKHSHSHGHDHHHDHHHDHGFEQPQGTREELMGCLCEKHKALAQATIAHKKAALEKRLQDEKEKPDDNNSEGGQSSEGKNPLGESSENKNVEEKGSQVESLEEKTSEVETSEGKITEDKKSEAENSGETNAEGTYSENKLFEDINSEDKNSLNERSVSETSESLEALGDKTCENNISEDKSSEDKSSENECKNVVCHDCNAGNSDIANGEESGAKVLLDKNKCYSQAELDAAERFIRKNYPELDMCSQHRNELSEKVEEKLKEDVTKETKELKNEIDSECKASKSSEEKCLESKSSEEKSSEGSKSLEDKSSGDQTAECKEPDETKSSKDDKLSPRRKKSHKVIRENGLISSDESDYGNDEIEMVLRKDFPEFHLCEPHPNEIYRTITAVEEGLKQIESVISGNEAAEFEKEARVEMDATEAKLNGRMEDGEDFAINGTREDGEDLSEPRDEEDDEFASEKSNDTRDDEDEGSGKEKSKEIKLRTCAFCRVQETEVKTFKKCQKCKGKRTKFYCGRDCQRMDWIKHRLEH